jgi:hypothetical protein
MIDLVTIDGVRYAITDRQIVSYSYPESPEQRKARGEAEAPTISYTVATIERVRDE